MSPADHLIVVRGGGDIGTGVIWRLVRVGFPVIVCELERPLTVRRTVAFSTAVKQGSIEVEGVTAVRVDSPAEALLVARSGSVAVLVTSEMPAFDTPPSVVVDARLAKRPLDTSIDQAAFVVGLGPGFTTGATCDVVVETMRGHRLGRTIWEGSAAANTGVPGEIGGHSGQRILRAHTSGALRWEVSFGDTVETGQHLGTIDAAPITAAIGGTVRGLMLEGQVEPGLKIGDIDPRFDPSAIHEISDKSLSVGGGVLEAVLVWLNAQGA